MATEVVRDSTELTALQAATRTGALTNTPENTDPSWDSNQRRINRVSDLLANISALEVYKDGDLTFGVRSGRFNGSGGVITYAGATAQALTDDATNYIYLTFAGVLTVNTTGFPSTARVELGSITTADGAYTQDDGMTDNRDASMFVTQDAYSPAPSAFQAPSRYVKTEDIDFVLPADEVGADPGQWDPVTWDSSGLDADNCFCGLSGNSIYGIGANGETTGSLRYDFAAGTDFTGKVIVIRFYMHPASAPIINPQLDSYLTLTLWQSGLVKKFRKLQIWAAPNIRTDDRSELTGWYEIAVPVGNLLDTVGDDITDIIRLDLQWVSATDIENMKVTLDRVLVYTPGNATGYYNIHFDTKNENTVAAAQVLAEYGIRGSFGVSPVSDLSDASQRLIQRMGHEITTYTRGADLLGWPFKDDAQKIETMETNVQQFRAKGFRHGGAGILHLRTGPGPTPRDVLELEPTHVQLWSGSGPGTMRSAQVLNNAQSLWQTNTMYWTDFLDTGSIDDMLARMPAMIAICEAGKSVFVLGAHCAIDGGGDTNLDEIGGLDEVCQLFAASNLVNATLLQIARGDL